jgi:L-ribulose-5-phosphate 3-epimerase
VRTVQWQRMDVTSRGLDRRWFLGLGATALGARFLAAAPFASRPTVPGLAPGRGPGSDLGRGHLAEPLFPLSLAEWSLHKALFAKELDNLDFPKRASAFGFAGVEYVNVFWKDKARDAKYLAELKKRCADQGVRSVLIMCDGEGALGDADAEARTKAIENHHQWVDAAKELGCHSIRVNAQSKGSYEEQQKLAADGLHRLCEYGDKFDINVIVENHGGLSSNGKWLSETLKLAAHKRCGALPDFGNFRVSAKEEYDRYQGTDELMPFARGVSAKSHDFDEKGEEIHTDYHRMLEIVIVKHGYRGFVGVEYEGSKLSEDEGIQATKKLVEKVRDEIASKLEAAAKQPAARKQEDK